MTDQLEEVELESEEMETPVEPSAAKSYICMWDDVLPPDYCKETINLFGESWPQRISEDKENNFGYFELDILDPNLILRYSILREVSFFEFHRIHIYS